MTFQNPNEPTKSNGSQREDGMQRMMAAVMNAVYSRTRLMRMGGGDDGEADPRRNIARECGWPDTGDITPESLGDMYDRFAVGARVNDLYPEESWQVTPRVYEDEDPQTLTPFEEGLDDLAKQLRGESFYEGEEGNPLFEHLLRMDRLCGVGSYGVLLLGLDDGKKLNEPTDGLDETGRPSGSASGRKLLFLREFDERLAPVNAWETEVKNPRYGQPTSYNLTFDDPKLTGVKGSGRATEQVHWSRVVHVADNLTTSDVFGVPRMRPVFNDLLDLRKLYGGSAEMYWQGAFPGVGFKTDPQLGADVSFPTDFKDTMELYMNGLQRWLAIGGVEPRMLSPTVVSPEVQIKAHLEAICVRLGVPLRIFLGSERGELASSQDARAWNGRVQQRQNRFLTPRLIAPVVDRLIALGVLPKPARFMVEWPDISEKTDQEKMDKALKTTQAMGAYVQGNLESLITPMAYFTQVLDYTEEEAASILEEAETNVAEKLALDLPPIGQEFAKPEPAMPFGGQGQPIVDEQGQPLLPDERFGGAERDAEAELKKQELEEPKMPPPFAQNTYCATGPGGGKDPSCGKEDSGEGIDDAERSTSRLTRGMSKEEAAWAADILAEWEEDHADVETAEEWLQFRLEQETTMADEPKHRTMATRMLKKVQTENALPLFSQKDAAEEDVEEQDALLEEPELDPLTGEPVEPEIDPLTGEPVDVDPLTGEPIDGAGDPYRALLDEFAATGPERGGLLPSDHVPSLRDRLMRAGDEEGAGTATFGEDEDALLEEEPSEGEEPEEEPDEGEIVDDDGQDDEEEFAEEEEDEEVENAADDDCDWVTIGGQHVCIKGGKIVKGGSDDLRKAVNKPQKEAGKKPVKEGGTVGRAKTKSSDGSPPTKKDVKASPAKVAEEIKNYNEWSKQHDGPRLNSEERLTAWNYQNKGYININNVLRGGKPLGTWKEILTSLIVC
jgi:hypothetical protein